MPGEHLRQVATNLTQEQHIWFQKECRKLNINTANLLRGLVQDAMIADKPASPEKEHREIKWPR